MLLKGEALIQSFTFGFSIHGQRGDWKVMITAPGGVVDERETKEAVPYLLFNEMLADACETASHNRIPAHAGAGR